MPITVPTELRRVSQKEFGAIAFRVMEVVFAVHNELGRFLNEDLYLKEIAQRIPAANVEVPIHVSHEDFRKDYYLDLLVESAAPFELKAVDVLTGRHRAQLVNYLMLLELMHGKLVNLRPNLVEHEFINTTLSRSDRCEFDVQADEWQSQGSRDIRDWLVAALRD